MNTILKQVHKHTTQANNVSTPNNLTSFMPLPVSPPPAGGGKASMPQLTLASTQVNNNKRSVFDGLRTLIAAASASLVMTGVMIPFVASVVMVAIYLALPNVLIPLSFLSIGPGSKWYAIVDSTILTALVWFIAVLLYSPFTFARVANPRSYGLLKSRLCQLKANLDIEDTDYELKTLEAKYGDIKAAVDKIQSVQSSSTTGITCECNQVARTDALACYINISMMLNHTPAGLLWALGTGYINAWGLLHHAEEALIEFECGTEAVRGAMHDKLAIQGSVIGGEDELLDKLKQAVSVLEPAAAVYFKEHQTKNCTPLDQLAEVFKKNALEQLFAQNRLEDDISNKSGPKAESMARVALREVRSTLNSFRDKSWEGIVRARNRLLASIALTGIITHILLCIAILTSNLPDAGHPASALIAATAFYLIGAVTGLFGRFYRESVAGTAVDDFGFSITRLIATPLLSGLASIGGVLVTVMFTALGGSALGDTMPPHIMLDSIFRLDPRLLFAAAIFGLTPNLLIKGLQEKAQKFESDIQSSRAAEPASIGSQIPHT